MVCISSSACKYHACRVCVCVSEHSPVEYKNSKFWQQTVEGQLSWCVFLFFCSLCSQDRWSYRGPRPQGGAMLQNLKCCILELGSVLGYIQWEETNTLSLYMCMCAALKTLRQHPALRNALNHCNILPEKCRVNVFFFTSFSFSPSSSSWFWTHYTIVALHCIITTYQLITSPNLFI